MANPEKNFINYLNELKTKALDNNYLEKFEKYNNYYANGNNISQKENSPNPYNEATNNQIKPIIDTKSTLVLDQQVQTVVEERSLNNANFETVQAIKNEASILNDCLKNVFINNSYENLLAKDIIKGAAINGCSVVKVFWDANKMEGAGDVGIENISPDTIFFDPGATEIDNCNYIFVKKEESIFDLKKKYSNNKDVLKMLESVSPSEKMQSDQSSSIQNGRPIVGKTSSETTVMYNYGNESMQKSLNTYTVWECFLKDDTVLQYTPDDTSQQTKEVLKEESLKYPNGRVIIYMNDTILEDKAIDYPFGFPFQIFAPEYAPSKIFGQSQIKNLCKLQDKLNMLEIKTRKMIREYQKVTLYPTELNLFDNNKAKITNDKNAYVVPPNTLSKGINISEFSPVDFSAISAFEQEKMYVENQMMNVARVNKMMISGERPVGVDSGKMVNELNHSPMVSIREQQKSYRDFLIGLSNKVISIIQFYYTDDRIFKTTTGEYIEIGNTIDPQTLEPQRTIAKSRYNENDGVMESIFKIKSDPSIMDFCVKISTGNAVARSASQTAELTYKMATDPNFLDLPINMKKLLLESLDYPNWKALIEEEEKEKLEAQERITDNDMILQRIAQADIKPKDLMSMITALPPELMSAQIQSIEKLLEVFELIPPIASSPSTQPYPEDAIVPSDVSLLSASGEPQIEEEEMVQEEII